MPASRSNRGYGVPIHQGDEPASNDAPNTLVADEAEFEGPHHQEQPFDDDDDVADEMEQISGTNAMLPYEDNARNRRCRKAALIGLIGLTFACSALAVALVGGQSQKTSSGTDHSSNTDGKDYSYGPPQDWGKSSCGRATAELSALTHIQPVEGSPISRIAFASCFRPYLQVSDALWRHMRETFQPELFIWLGDNMCTLCFMTRVCHFNTP